MIEGSKRSLSAPPRMPAEIRQSSTSFYTPSPSTSPETLRTPSSARSTERSTTASTPPPDGATDQHAFSAQYEQVEEMKRVKGAAFSEHTEDAVRVARMLLQLPFAKCFGDDFTGVDLFLPICWDDEWARSSTRRGKVRRRPWRSMSERSSSNGASVLFILYFGLSVASILAS